MRAKRSLRETPREAHGAALPADGAGGVRRPGTAGTAEQ